jgi:dihydropteroate synthase
MAGKKIMGVLNITPDSFSDGGAFLSLNDAIAQGKKMQAEGADIIDIGGESTRPNASKISIEVEKSRVLPVIKALSSILDIPISIDSSKPEVIQSALEAGASIINDVCALQTPNALETAAQHSAEICLMHMQGNPETMQNKPTYTHIVDEVSHFFEQRIEACVRAGISEKKLILDPGFGFGKTLTHNLELLRNLKAFSRFGLKLLVGISRKSMIGNLLNNRCIDERIFGSVTANVLACQNGADIVRVHEVRPMRDALTILQAI